ncbi:hypothetical protein XENTR_v10009690 [Xenopus tropicalis]|nr:hypothetical protein XENTR_v10009690 [Xenopus tropicalis]
MLIFHNKYFQESTHVGTPQRGTRRHRAVRERWEIIGGGKKSQTRGWQQRYLPGATSLLHPRQVPLLALMVCMQYSITQKNDQISTYTSKCSSKIHST